MTERLVMQINRIGYPLLAGFGMLFHLIERSVDIGLRISLPITEYIGDTAFGFDAVTIGLGLTFILVKTRLIESQNAKNLSLIISGILFGLILLNETIGLGGGTPDILDIPAAAVGFIGAAALSKDNE